MAPAAELARPPRIPKLTYRNPLPVADDSSINSKSSSACEASDSSGSRQLLTPPSTPKLTLESDARSITSSGSISLASSDGSVSRESKSSTTKKKKNGVLNFLALKEPSQNALEQFAEAQRKQTAAKGQPLQSGAPQKLPSTVPKVNSKWDGVPESVKSSQNSVRSSKRNSTWSYASSQKQHSGHTRNTPLDSSASSIMSRASRGPPNSLASPMHSAIDVCDYTDSSSSSDPPSRSDSLSAASTTIDSRSFSPDKSSSSSPSPVPHAEHSWSPPPHPSESDTDPSLVFITEFKEKLTIDEPDPATSDEVNAIFRRLKGGASESQHTYYGSDDDDPDVPNTHDFLFDVRPILPNPPTRIIPPYQTAQTPTQPSSPTISTLPPPHSAASPTTNRPPANFSRPRPIVPVPDRYYAPPSVPKPKPKPQQPPQRPLYARHKSNAPSLPTLYEVSIASTSDSDADSDATEVERCTTRDSIQSTESSSAPSIAPSMAPSVATSVTPSVMSASWYRSPQERLGLGGRIRKTDVLPWEDGGTRGKQKRSRLAIFSRG